MFNNQEKFSIKSNKPYYSNTSFTLTQKASRFWIPFDVKLFETLTPLEYLENYCRVSNRRYTIYKRIFDRHKDFEATLTIENLPDALSDVYMETIDIRLITQVINLLDLSLNIRITFAQFRGIAAFSERYFFHISNRSNDIDPQLTKDIIEILDFSSLEWKLTDIKISPILRDILKFL
ncbi:unnamed protein product [Adineta steineri]|uniref:Uncharacterized protein n=1 Tax=Adineta steineri TaxID=433720 RepID=A0A814RVZ3_9BILA|nr:unnamed protein product [Adineta steineri]CAF1434942.1 unnamed protein product [Adineta steineri]